MAAFILAVGLRFVAVVAMVSPLLTQANHLQAERITRESGGQMADDVSKPTSRSGPEFKDLLVVVPLFATVVAISWQVGVFMVSGGFYYFSLSEHLLGAVAALPIALFATVVLIMLVANARNWIPGEWLSEERRPRTVVLLILAGLLLLGVGFYWRTFFGFTLGFGAVLMSTVVGSDQFRRSDALSIELYALLGSALPFAAGIDIQRFSQSFANDNPQSIKLKSGTISGFVAMAGERGLLIFRPDTKTYVFIRSDDLLSVEYTPASLRTKKSDPGVR